MARARIERGAIGAIVTGDLVIVRSADGRLFALDAKDGKRRWLFQRSSRLFGPFPRGHDRRRGYLLTGFAGGKLRVDRARQRRRALGDDRRQPRGATELERVDVVGLPIVSEREVCAWLPGAHRLLRPRERQRALVARAVEHRRTRLDARYVLSATKRARCTRWTVRGATIWKQDRLFLRRLSAPLAPWARDAVGDVEGYVHFLSRESGASSAASPPTAARSDRCSCGSSAVPGADSGR